jgi:hypothetical protein
MNIYQFNSLYAHKDNKDLIRKALTSATNQGEALIPEKLEDVITNTAVRLVPELAVPVLRFDNQKFHSFNRLTSIPSAGSAQGEASTTVTKRSSYTRDSLELKIMKRKGAVTGFLKDSSAGYIDAVAAEMENHVQSFGNDMRTYMIHGNTGADSYAFDGLDTFISTNRVNLTLSGGVQANLKLIDAMIDANTRRQGQPHRKVLLMSPEMLSALSSLWTVVRDTRPAQRGTEAILVDGGYRLENYRGVPILETTSTRPVVDMGTVTLASAGSGGAIPDDEYFFRVAPVTWDGEQICSAGSNSVSTTNADTITLSFTAVENALFYKVYCGDAAGNETLVKVFSAFTYDADGTITGDVTSLVFSSNPLTPDATSVPTHMQSDLPLERDGTSNEPMEYIILWDLDEYQGLGKLAYTNQGGSRFRGLITPMELAQTDDNYPFLLKSYTGLIPSFEATSYLVRGIRTE